ncbi:hypothetical protein COOONC_04877 [Cooperia oncophora]
MIIPTTITGGTHKNKCLYTPFSSQHFETTTRRIKKTNPRHHSSAKSHTKMLIKEHQKQYANEIASPHYEAEFG